MAQPIQDPGIGTSLQSLFRLQGRVRPALEEFVIPTVQVADLSLGARPPVIRHASCLFDQAAVVGERFVFRFEAIPGTICVIRKLHVFSAAGAANFSANFSGNAAVQAALPTTADKSFTDGRLLTGSPSGAQQPSGVLTVGTAAASPFPTPHFRMRIPATGGVFYEPPGGWVVGTGNPGLFGFFEGMVALNNSQVFGSFEWDEYSVF